MSIGHQASLNPEVQQVIPITLIALTPPHLIPLLVQLPEISHPQHRRVGVAQADRGPPRRRLEVQSWALRKTYQRGGRQDQVQELIKWKVNIDHSEPGLIQMSDQYNSFRACPKCLHCLHCHTKVARNGGGVPSPPPGAKVERRTDTTTREVKIQPSECKTDS